MPISERGSNFPGRAPTRHTPDLVAPQSTCYFTPTYAGDKILRAPQLDGGNFGSWFTRLEPTNRLNIGRLLDDATNFYTLLALEFRLDLNGTTKEAHITSYGAFCSDRQAGVRSGGWLS